jgi:hypothetical protein
MRYWWHSLSYALTMPVQLVSCLHGASCLERIPEMEACRSAVNAEAERLMR